MIDGLFENRKSHSLQSLTKFNAPSTSLSPVEHEFVAISSTWNDYNDIFNSFSRVQDLLYPLACYHSSSTTREGSIQEMKGCLQSICNFSSSFLPSPSLLQNSLLYYTDYVNEAFQKYVVLIYIL